MIKFSSLFWTVDSEVRLIHFRGQELSRGQRNYNKKKKQKKNKQNKTKKTMKLNLCLLNRKSACKGLMITDQCHNKVKHTMK